MSIVTPIFHVTPLFYWNELSGRAQTLRRRAELQLEIVRLQREPSREALAEVRQPAVAALEHLAALDRIAGTIRDDVRPEPESLSARSRWMRIVQHARACDHLAGPALGRVMNGNDPSPRVRDELVMRFAEVIAHLDALQSPAAANDDSVQLVAKGA